MVEEFHEKQVVLSILSSLQVLTQDQEDFENEFFVEQGDQRVMQLGASSGGIGGTWGSGGGGGGGEFRVEKVNIQYSIFIKPNPKS